MDDNWKNNLTPEQIYILREEGTEPPGSSPLNQEKREGDYICAGCGTKLFNSETKYESGSGWPSFFSSLPGVFETKTDTHIGYERVSIIVKNVADIMAIFLKMVLRQLEKGTVTMDCV